MVRAERLEAPVDYISAILSRVNVSYIQKQYNLPDWFPNDDTLLLQDGNSTELTKIVDEEEKESSHIRFLTKLAHKMGKLLKGNEPDLRRVAVMVINDWQRVSDICICLYINT